MTDIKRFEPLWDVWRTEKLIGEGSFGKVYRAVREEFGKKYYAAVKHISIPSSESQITEAISEGVPDDKESIKEYFEAIASNLINEIALMNEVKGNSNIVSYVDHLIIPKESGVGYDVIIRMELLTGLNDVLQHRQFTNMDVIKLGIDLCSALEVCEEKGIIHRDIKPSNIFVNDLGDYKLGDFGVARQLEHTTAGMSKKGTYIYMAPEVYRGEPANFSADMFSLGIVMYRLLNGNRAPFLPVGSAKIKPGDNENALARRMAGEPLPAPAFADDDLAEIVLKATQFDRSERYASPTEFKEALQSLHNTIENERSIPVIAAPTGGNSYNSSDEATDSGSTVLPLNDSGDTDEKTIAVANPRDKHKKTSTTQNKRTGWIVGAAAAAIILLSTVLFFVNNIIFNGQIIKTAVADLDLHDAEITDITALSRCKRIKSLDLSKNNITDISPLLECKTLQELNLFGNAISEESFDELEKALPNCNILWTVNIDGNQVESNSQTVDLSGKKIKDYSNLSYLTDVKKLTMVNCGLEDSDMLQIREMLPDCTVIWDVELYGKHFNSIDTNIDLSGVKINSFDELNNKLHIFKNITKINLTNCGLENEVIYQQELNMDGVDVIWNVELFGKVFSTDSTVIDLRGTENVDLSLLESNLIYFDKLKKLKLPPLTDKDNFDNFIEKFPKVDIRRERYDMSLYIKEATEYGESMGLKYGGQGALLCCLGSHTYERKSYNEMINSAKWALNPYAPMYPESRGATNFTISLDETEVHNGYIDYSDLICLYKN